MGAYFKRDAKPQEWEMRRPVDLPLKSCAWIARCQAVDEGWRSRLAVEPPAFLGSTPDPRVTV